MRETFLRQIGLLGEGCQKRLAKATILVAGLGGLGTVVAEALVRLGVGRIYLLDDGLVDPPDLNRQVLYRWDDIGKAKAPIAAQRLGAVAPWIEAIPIESRVEPGFQLPGDAEGVVDCLDNFGDRFTLADLAWRKGIFLVHGGIEGYWGQVTTILRGETPTLREVFKGVEEGRREIQVIIPTSGIVAFLQALEVVRNLCGMEPTLKGRILAVDLASFRFDLIELSPVV